MNIGEITSFAKKKSTGLSELLEGAEPIAVDPDGNVVDNAAAAALAQTVGVDSPYLSARRTWNDHMARAVAARALWQLVALASLLVAIGAVGGFLHLAAKPQFVPYVVEVDATGHVRAAKPAEQVTEASREIIEAQLEKFITLSRRVTTDISLQSAAIFGVFAMLTPDDPAARKMEEHLNGDEGTRPYQRAETETVNTEIRSILQQTKDTWQLDWTETVYTRKGHLKERFAMRALVQVYQADRLQTTEEALRQNPLGVYIREFTWNRHEGREVHQ